MAFYLGNGSSYVQTGDRIRVSRFLDGDESGIDSGLRRQDVSSKLLGSRDWLKTLDATTEQEGFENVRKIIYQDSAYLGTF
ncbi:hypothetical protein VHEMI02838 [[Torrubiella] hemipterigena]|uniref:Uncharacterized protein n=1 Tax=[Torrubiella] hemipterigena TaxID=1531966 RepID=A0A0A1T9E1_9HYPO|nr:hypothetical protein VHEMI02838 [[Torrubiella] hemipterigena]